MDKFDYVKMQKDYYEGDAEKWSLNDLDRVVGWFHDHNAWEDYEYLFKDTPNLQDKTVLDFGCGPGRNLVRYAGRFKQFDGVDMAKTNLEKAKVWITHNKLDTDDFKLIECNGYDLSNIPDNSYDLIISTICLQHIAVHELRLGYFKEFYRVLRPNGQISLQMGFGDNRRATLTSEYYDNNYSAPYTNGGCDVKVRHTDQLKGDLEPIGFTDFNFHIRPTVPGDRHDHAIYFNAKKL